MLARLANGLAAVGGAGLVSQGPAFQAQYLQQLAGRLAQTREDLSASTRQAAELGLSLPDYLNRAAQDAVGYARAPVEDALNTYQRMQHLQQAYDTLMAAGPVERPFVLLQVVDPAIAQATFDHFQPALPLAVEGLVYGGVGLLVGLMLLAGLERGGRACYRAVRRKRRPVLVRSTREPAGDPFVGERRDPTFEP